MATEDNYISRTYEELSVNDLKEEYILLKLRMNEGFDLSEYKNKFDEGILKIKEKEINELLKSNLIKIEENRLTTTYQGMLLLDMVIVKLI